MNKQLIFKAVNEFIADRQLQNRSPKTIQFYSSELKFIAYYLNANAIYYMEDITVAVLKNYLLDLSKTRNNGGLSCSYRTLKAWLNFYWFTYEPATSNPILKVKITNHKQPPLPEIPIDEVRLLIASSNSIRDTSIIMMLCDGGFRAMELCQLNISSVNLDNGQVVIEHGKADKMRITFVGKNTISCLKKYLSTRKVFKTDDPLFVSNRGTRFGYFGLRSIITKLSRRAGLHERGLHSFRRLCALSLYRNHVDILSISRILGHSNIQVSLRYLNLNNEDLRDAFISTSDLL